MLPAGDVKSRAKRIISVFVSEFLSPNVESSSNASNIVRFVAFRVLCAVTLAYCLASSFSNHHFSFPAACHCLVVVLRNCTKAKKKKSAVKERNKQRRRPFCVLPCNLLLNGRPHISLTVVEPVHCKMLSHCQ